MKLVKIAAFGVVGLLALAVLVLLFGVPAEPLIRYAADRAADAGYQLRISGPSRLSLWPSLNVAADDVAVSSADQPSMLSAKRVRASISLLGLFAGDVRLSDLSVVEPVMRLTSGQAASKRARDDGAPRSIAIDRLTVENGTLIMRDVRENLEGHIDAIQLSGSLPAQGPLDLHGDGKVGNQFVRVTAKADSFAQIVAGRPTPIDATIELPGLLKAPLALTANVKSANQVVSIDGIRGNTGPGRLTGSVSIDASGAKPRATANLIADRIELVPLDAHPEQRNAPWSDQPFDFAVLRVFEANINVSARELVFRNIRLASADIASQLSGGLMSLQLSRAEFYGGPVQGKIVIDAASRTPRYGGSLEFSRVNALPLLTDAVDFGHLEGRLQAKLDLTAEGPSPAAVVASLGGTAQFGLEDGAVRDVNLPGMIRALSSQTLQGWQDKGRESTELTNLVAAFRITDGQAVTEDLHMAGPLIRVTGKGSANLVTRTLDFRVEPKLVLSLQGQGGPSDPVGLGVPVVVRGTFSEPQIYPDVAGILDNPEAAFSRLKSMGGALFGLLGGGQSPLGGQQPGQPSDNRKKVDEVVKSLDQMIRGGGDGRARQPSPDTKNQVRDVIRDLLGR